MSTQLTQKLLRDYLPVTHHGNISAALVKQLNRHIDNADSSEDLGKYYLEYAHILQDTKVDLLSYLNSVNYVSYLLAGLDEHEAYKKTFPVRYATLRKQRASPVKLARICKAYRSTKIVASIYERALVPAHILHHDKFIKALDIQMGIMQDSSVAPKTRSDAAAHVMTVLKAPEKIINQHVVEIEPEGALSVLGQMQQVLDAVSDKQAQAIQTKVINASDVIALDILPSTETVSDE